MPTAIVASSYINPHILQLQRIFMGEDFWTSLKSSIFFFYLRDKGVTSDAYWFAEVLQKMYTTSLNKMKALGTLSVVPFDRKSESSVTIRSLKSKRKLPPEAYAVKKKVEEKDSVAQIKEKSALVDAVSGDAGMVNPNGMVAPKSSKSSKSGKNNAPSPLSGKHNPEEPIPEPPQEKPSSRWEAITNIFSSKGKHTSSEVPAKGKIGLPAISIPEPISLSGDKNRAIATGLGAHSQNSEKPPSPGVKLFASFTTMLSSSSTSPPKAASSRSLVSMDDTSSPGKNKDIHDADSHQRRGHTVVTLSPISPRAGANGDDHAQSPREARERRRSAKYNEAIGEDKCIGAKYSENGVNRVLDDGTVVSSPRRSIKLEKIVSPTSKS